MKLDSLAQAAGSTFVRSFLEKVKQLQNKFVKHSSSLRDEYGLRKVINISALLEGCCIEKIGDCVAWPRESSIRDTPR